MPPSRASANLACSTDWPGSWPLRQRDPLRPSVTGPIDIGDDAALWQPEPETFEVLTTDALVEDIHFRLSTSSWRALGWKALGREHQRHRGDGRTAHAGHSSRWACGLERAWRTSKTCITAWPISQAHLLETGGYDPAIVGGDIVSSPDDVPQHHGRRRAPRARSAPRSRASPAIWLAVTGALGGSARRTGTPGSGRRPPWHPRRRNVDRASPGPRATGRGGAHTGRGRHTLRHGPVRWSTRRSRQARLRLRRSTATIRADQVPLPPALERMFPGEAISMAVRGGEDYELLVAGPADRIAEASRLLAERELMPLKVIGVLTEGTPGLGVGPRCAGPTHEYPRRLVGPLQVQPGQRVTAIRIAVLTTSPDQTRHLGIALGARCRTRRRLLARWLIWRRQNRSRPGAGRGPGRDRAGDQSVVRADGRAPRPQSRPFAPRTRRSVPVGWPAR